MPIRITADLSAVKALLRDLTGAFDFTVPLERAGIILMRSTDLNFQAQGRPNLWEPLSEFTLEIRRTRTDPPPTESELILIDTGKLRQSYQRGGEGNVYELTPAELNVWSALEYAKIQQEGGFAGVGFGGGSHSIYIPARPHAMVQPEDAEDIEQTFGDWIGEHFGP